VSETARQTRLSMSNDENTPARLLQPARGG
jgi:hypothetical protein